MESKLKAQCMESVGELPAGYLHLPTTPIKKDPQLTDWISGDLKPVRDGVYLRKYHNGDQYCLFIGNFWHVGVWGFLQIDFNQEISDYQNLPWRGLSSNPNEVQP